MHTQRRLASAAVLLAMSVAVSSAQSVTSAHSGTLHYFEGSVKIDGVQVESKVGKFSEIKENSVLDTLQGRAEVLLTPGVFLRVGENTSIKMLDNRLLSTRVELLSGSAIVESDDPEVSVKDPAVTILYKDYQIQPLKYGVFEISTEPGQIKVFKGQANVIAGSIRTQVKEGRLVPFTAALLSEKFNEKQGDDLYLWTRDRSAALSAANMSSARTLASNGYSMGNLFTGGGYPGLGYASQFQGGWYFNQGLSMYTYLPYGGTMYSPFGYGFFSPTSIYSFYSPGGYYWNGGGGARTGSGFGTPINSGATLTAGSIGRLGSSGSLAPTLGSPLRGSTSVSNGVAYRGGFQSGGSGSGSAASGTASTALARSGGISSGGGGFSGGSVSAGRASAGGSGARGR